MVTFTMSLLLRMVLPNHFLSRCASAIPARHCWSWVLYYAMIWPNVFIINWFLSLYCRIVSQALCDIMQEITFTIFKTCATRTASNAIVTCNSWSANTTHTTIYYTRLYGCKHRPNDEWGRVRAFTRSKCHRSRSKTRPRVFVWRVSSGTLCAPQHRRLM